ncbi:DUF1887 family CARF protein [uncultured Clostridium sp.]|uniref:Card1-like endonuclease domain-containing protein n=1 Tax=uncultured Clostridium sp. TaxID=59620 RepID=UPI0026299920|nr:DUF1887 family CARF protein [uncultured Clostridium sp.]
MYSLLITPIDEHNDSTVILIKKYKFKKVIVLVSEKCSNYIKATLIEVANIYNSKIEFLEIKGECFSDLDKLIKGNEKALINLTGGERIQSLCLLKYILENNLEGIYVDIVGRKKYIFGENTGKVDEHLIDLDIEEMINATGNKVFSHETELVSKEYVLDMAKMIHRNIDLWNKYKRRIYDPNVFAHYYGNTKKVVINDAVITDDEKEILEKILEWGIEKGLITLSKEKGNRVIEFKDKCIKGFIFKVGTWLEVLTEHVVEQIASVDQVKSGLMFIWNKDKDYLKNELDVVAIRDSTIIVISCKDSEKYEEATLNELNVYSERIGGHKVKKILVATKKPHKENIIERAKEMGINIIILEKDLDIFKEKLEKVINS